jgi:lauroyl/myristoyl acyltransferase
LRETEPELLLGIAWRNAGQIQISLASISYVPSDSDEEILTKVNQQLEAAIDRHPDQYRWSDKRFNIRPPGEPKIYR